MSMEVERISWTIIGPSEKRENSETVHSTAPA